MNKTVKLGTTKTSGGRWVSILVNIRYKDKRLSITGNAVGIGYGQIFDSIQPVRYAPGINLLIVRRLQQIWEDWHLNDMRSGCEHQREQRWDTWLIDPSKPATQSNMLMWKSEAEGGLLGRACDQCGFKFGSAWLFEEVPQDVLDFLESLPDNKLNR